MAITIDEAIVFCNEKANNIKLKAEPEVFVQLAEWLEELKWLRKEKDKFDRNVKFFNEINVNSHKEGYDKAIDDFVKFASVMPIVEGEDVTIRPMWLKEMAEQLKAGEENDKRRKRKNI